MSAFIPIRARDVLDVTEGDLCWLLRQRNVASDVVPGCPGRFRGVRPRGGTQDAEPRPVGTFTAATGTMRVPCWTSATMRSAFASAIASTHTLCLCLRRKKRIFFRRKVSAQGAERWNQGLGAGFTQRDRGRLLGVWGSLPFRGGLPGSSKGRKTRREAKEGRWGRSKQVALVGATPWVKMDRPASEPSIPGKRCAHTPHLLRATHLPHTQTHPSPEMT